MPNLVVYVPADVARVLEAKGVSEDVQRRACREVLVGLADGGLGAGELDADVPGPVRSPSPAPSPRVPLNSVSGFSPDARKFRPDPKGKK